MLSEILKVTDFAICWLRAYDFGLDQEDLEKAVEFIKPWPLVEQIAHVARADEVDVVDSKMFDVRYQERSKLIRLRFQGCRLIDQTLGPNPGLNADIRVYLTLDLSSGFGVFNLVLTPSSLSGSQPFAVQSLTMKEIVFLTSQWLLLTNEAGEAQRLKVQLPGLKVITPLYVRELMNFYFLQSHKFFWEIARPRQKSPLQKYSDLADWIQASHESDPKGCDCYRQLYQSEMVRSLFPTSFGPILDIWGIEGTDARQFDDEAFYNQYANELALFFTDGQRTHLGETLQNQRNTRSLALYVWPNHALYINQNPNALTASRVEERVKDYGCLDVEVIRIFEILNLQSALMHAYDRLLDEQLEAAAQLPTKDQERIIRLTKQHRDNSRSMRNLDFFNLFHTAYWEPLYARLLENPHLKFRNAAQLVEVKSSKLGEEIQQAVIIQDRARQRQQREQELAVLRGLHHLSLANDTQSNVLMIINLIVSATASFALLEVLAPWLAALTNAEPSFQQAHPFAWVSLNCGFVLLLTIGLFLLTTSRIHNKSQVIEVNGMLDYLYDPEQLLKNLNQRKELAYFYIDTDDWSGYMRLQKPMGTILFEFERQRFTRFTLLFHGSKLRDPQKLKQIYVTELINELRDQKVIVDSLSNQEYDGMLP